MVGFTCFHDIRAKIYAMFIESVRHDILIVVISF